MGVATPLKPPLYKNLLFADISANLGQVADMSAKIGIFFRN